MNLFSRASAWVMGTAVVLGLVVLYLFWHWAVERVEVEPGEYLIVIHKWGKDLPEGEVIAPDDSYKGVQRDPVKEGRHFFNPIFWTYERHKMVHVPTGKCLVLTRKYGKEIPKERLAAGHVLAGDDERGIVPEVLMPGHHRLNPHAYEWKLADAVQVGIDEVGVKTLKVGHDPRRLPAEPGKPRYVVPEGYRGIQEKPVPPGTYYLNPYVATITPVEVRNHRVEMHDIEFPSHDGFILKPEVVMIEYRLLPEAAPEALVRLADEGALHQKDSTEAEQLQNEVLQKVILPHIRGYARLKGSNYDAKDFIVTGAADGANVTQNSRERLQSELFEEVQPRCRKNGVEVLAVKLGNLNPPEELKKLISERDLARVELEKNKTLVGQYKSEQELKAKEAETDRAKLTVEARARLSQSEIRAKQRLEVERLRLEQELKNAEFRLAAAQKQAEAKLARGKAEAEVIHLQNEAEVAGLRKAISGFPSPGHYAQYQVMSRLAPSLTEIFASDDGDFARLFANFMAPPAATNGPTRSPVADIGPKMPSAK